MSGFKLSRVPLVAFLFGSVNFLTAGLGACLFHFFDPINHGNAPEMFGWWGYLSIVGLMCITFNSGALIVNSIFTIFSKASSRWILLLTSIEAFFFGILFLLSAFMFECLENHIKYTSLIQIMFWVLLSVFSMIGWMIGDRFKKRPVYPVNPVEK